jgi:hypothetical protein
MASQGFLPLDEFMKLKGIGQKTKDADVPTLELKSITNVLREESEESSDGLEEVGLAPDHCRSACKQLPVAPLPTPDVTESGYPCLGLTPGTTVNQHASKFWFPHSRRQM